LRDYTGGSLGTQPARAGNGISLYAVQFEPDRVLSYYVVLALWAFGLVVWLRIDRSMDRYALDAANQDEDAAASVGIDVTREKLKVTAISPPCARWAAPCTASTRCISARTPSRVSACLSTSCSP
jgi:branched-chain amino acid transport system permease protein